MTFLVFISDIIKKQILEGNKMKYIFNMVGMTAMLLLFLLSFNSCKSSTDNEEKSVEFYDTYNEVGKWCSCILPIENGSGDYEFDVNDKEGVKLSFDQEKNQLIAKGMKEGIYHLTVTDKQTLKVASAVLKVLPQALLISFNSSKNSYDHSPFSYKDDFFLMGDAYNTCFIFPSPVNGAADYRKNPTFEGFYQIEEKDGKPANLLLFDKNKNKIHTYELEGTSAEALSCLSRLLHRQSWEQDELFLQDDKVVLIENQNTLKAKIALVSTFIPKHYYNLK